MVVRDGKSTVFKAEHPEKQYVLFLYDVSLGAEKCSRKVLPDAMPTVRVSIIENSKYLTQRECSNELVVKVINRENTISSNGWLAGEE